MRINPFFVPIALIAALLGSAVIASAAGVWSTSARTTIDTASMTPADLKGWMTLQQVMDGLHISQSELYELGKIPADIPPATALKDMEGVAPDFEVTGLRDALMARLGTPAAPAPATPEPTATATPQAAPAVAPGAAITASATVTGTHLGDGEGTGPTPLPPGQVLPADQIKGALTLRQVSEQCVVPLDALLNELKLPSGTDADTAIKTLISQGALTEVTQVRDAVIALQKK